MVIVLSAYFIIYWERYIIIAEFNCGFFSFLYTFVSFSLLYI